MLRYWKIVAGLTLVFAAGGVCGSVVTHQFIKRGVERAMNFDRWKEGIVHVLQSKLNLTPSQHQKIEALVDQRGREIRGTFSKTFSESGHILVQLQHQIDEELTPEQRAIHEQMKRDFRAHLKKRFNFDLPQD
jgi:Spy/CpxP family protein refolding chaperone